jgi:competence protein ComEA
MDQIPREWRAVTEGGEAHRIPATGGGFGRTRLFVAGASGVLALVFAGTLWLGLSAGSGREVAVDAASPSTSAGPGSAEERVVYLAGAVRRPGVYRLPAGSRVGDAVAAAGGFASTVDAAASQQRLNLAAPIEDGSKILVPERGSGASTAAEAGADATPETGEGSLVDVNRAAQSELEELPGIGPVTAKKILEARAEAPFRTVEELRDRKVVGSSTFDKIRELVTVGA